MGGKERRQERVAEAHGAGERRPGLRAAGTLAAALTAPIVARRGGGTLARLKAEWNAVAGPEFAAISWPDALGRDGALKLRVRPGLALELQHRAPLLLERINGFFGRPVAARLVLVQAMPPTPERTRAAPPPPLDPASGAALDARLRDIADPDLRAALAGLGRLVLQGTRGS